MSLSTKSATDPTPQEFVLGYDTDEEAEEAKQDNSYLEDEDFSEYEGQAPNVDDHLDAENSAWLRENENIEQLRHQVSTRKRHRREEEEPAVQQTKKKDVRRSKSQSRVDRIKLNERREAAAANTHVVSSVEPRVAPAVAPQVGLAVDQIYNNQKKKQKLSSHKRRFGRGFQQGNKPDKARQFDPHASLTIVGSDVSPSPLGEPGRKLLNDVWRLRVSRPFREGFFHCLLHSNRIPAQQREAAIQYFHACEVAKHSRALAEARSESKKKSKRDHIELRGRLGVQQSNAGYYKKEMAKQVVVLKEKDIVLKAQNDKLAAMQARLDEMSQRLKSRKQAANQ
jgi:hypothetical protein